jgi:hypothetical protein
LCCLIRVGRIDTQKKKGGLASYFADGTYQFDSDPNLLPETSELRIFIDQVNGEEVTIVFTEISEKLKIADNTIEVN